MYSSIQLVFKYLNYRFSASNGKGHGIHSPFVFEFVTRVLNGKKDKTVYSSIEQLRHQLLRNNEAITVEDLGAGSRKIGTQQRRISQIASTSLKPAKYSQLLHRMVQFYQPATILEIGTSLGITSSYIAKANPQARVVTMEGVKDIATTAKQNFTSLSIQNIEVVLGNFNDTLAPTLTNIPTVDLAFIDGNHRYEPTIGYFQQVLAKSNQNTIIILDDIHWSKEMEQAWEWVKDHEQVRLTIDLFAIGIVVLRPEILHKQHFHIRY